MRGCVQVGPSVFGRGKIVTLVIKAGLGVIAPDDRVLEASRRRPVNSLRQEKFKFVSKFLFGG